MFGNHRKPVPVIQINAPNYIQSGLQKELAGKVEAGSVVEIRLVDGQWNITKRPDREEAFELHHAVLINDSMDSTLVVTASTPGDMNVELCNVKVPAGTFLRGLLFSRKA